jgi:hypothetical protein
MNTIRTLGLGVLLLLAARPGLAQIEVDLTFPNLDIFYIGDLDPFGSGGQIENFEIVFSVQTGGNYAVDLFLDYQGGINLVNSHLSITGVQPGSYSYTLADFRNDQATFGGSIGSSHTDFNDSAIEDLAFAGNTLPAGTYTLRLEAVVNSQSLSASDDFVISAPLSISLQAPWNQSTVGSPFPNFLWSGRARAYQLLVAEFDPHRHGSHEEALEDVPMWVHLVGDVSQGLLAPTSAVYGDGGGARPLEPGRTYVWTVSAVMATTSGEEARTSPVWSFVYDPENEGGGPADPGYQALMDFLNGFLNGQVGELLALLEGMSLSGPILIDGQPVDPAVLMQIFEAIASGELNLAAMRLE